MTISSNIYAGKAFSEHPIAIYPLDDDISYISLISDSERLFNSGGWSASIDNSASVILDDSPTLPTVVSPFNSSIYTSASVGNISASATELVIESPELFDFSELNQTMKTFAISLYLYQSYSFVNWYEVGYKYYDPYLSTEKEIVTRTDATENSAWINFDNTYTVPNFDGTGIKLILRINLDQPLTGTGETEFIINGICIGQWSEGHSSESLGASVTASAALGYDGIPALEYGVQENSGYHIVEDNRLLAVNSGIPMVYGSDNLTKIYPSASANPSLIVPGQGFLNESGRYKDYTVEFWMRINPDTIESRRIFGPFDSDYGIYVRDGVISLLIGNSFASHPVSQWYRPMLIHIVIREGEARLYINGEQVISLTIDRSTLVLPEQNDWVGFYSYSDINNFEIDCISFYPYVMSTQVAKRRFVWGQGTDSPQNIANSYQGTNAYVNFSNAGYTTNKPYPDIGNWTAGYANNLAATRRSISSPNYSLPEVFIGGRDINDLYSDNKIVNELTGDKFFTFRPHVESNSFTTNGTKWTENGYLLFDSLDIFDGLTSLYGVFSTVEPDQVSTLMLIRNSLSNDVFEIKLDNGTIYYNFNSQTIASQTINEITYDQYFNYQGYGFEWGYSAPYGYGYGDIIGWEYSFAFGINIKNFIQNQSYQIRRFFQSPQNLQAYFGGNGSNTFIGKIHSVGFSNKTNYNEISSYFLNDGTVDYTEYEALVNHFATYTLTPVIRFNRFFLDISISSTWEEYFPLSFFAGYIKDLFGKEYYDVDMLQINIGYPAPTEIVSQVIENTGWTYLELHNSYNHPFFKPYEILDNSLITGYQNYSDLQNNNIVEQVISTEKSSLKSYVTFQLLAEGANQPLADFLHTEPIIECCFVDAESVNTNVDPYKAYKTKFEIVDKAVVFPPKNIDFKDVAMVVHFDIKQEGILSNPVRIRDFEIASRALGQYDFNPIGTEGGIPLYPYVKSGIYYDNKQKNPVRISKKRMPYLGLTEDSGIKVLGRQTFTSEYVVGMPVNQKQKQSLSVGAMQVWMKFDITQFPVTNYPLFEIQSLDKTIEFVVYVSASTQRGIVVPRNKRTKIIDNSVILYKNGNRVNNLYIEKGEWNSVGVEFSEPLSFDSYTGYINIFRGATFNNISYYPLEGLGQTDAILPRSWLRVLTADDIVNYDWQFWYDQNGTSEIQQWRDVYILEETRETLLTPRDIYKTFIGTNRVVVDDGSSLTVDSDSMKVISDASWNRFSLKPA